MQTDFRKRRKGRKCERDKRKERKTEKIEVSKLEENNKRSQGEECGWAWFLSNVFCCSSPESILPVYYFQLTLTCSIPFSLSLHFWVSCFSFIRSQSVWLFWVKCLRGGKKKEREERDKRWHGEEQMHCKTLQIQLHVLWRFSKHLQGHSESNKSNTAQRCWQHQTMNKIWKLIPKQNWSLILIMFRTQQTQAETRTLLLGDAWKMKTMFFF